MNVLGIAIKITNNGAGEPVVINEGGWTRHVADVRSVLSKVDGADSQNRRVVRFMSFTDEGCLLTVARYIGGRKGDNVAAWIFIPAKMAISGKDVIHIMDIAEKTILESSINPANLEQACRLPFPKFEEGYSKSPRGNALAYRFYDDISLENILGLYRYQYYYDDYAHIILLDKNDSLSIANPEEATDLSDGVNNPPSLLLPISREQFRQQLYYDVELQLEDGTPFTEPISIKNGEKVLLKIVREGFESITFPYLTPYNGGRHFISLDRLKPYLQNWQILYTISDIEIVDKNEKPITDDKFDALIIKVNGESIKFGESYRIYENKAKIVTIEVTDKRLEYKHLLTKVDFTKKPVRVILDYASMPKQATVVTSNGEEASLNYQVKRLELNEKSPLIGYYFDGEEHLVYDKRSSWIYRLQGFIVAAVISLACFLVVDYLSEEKAKIKNISAPIEVHNEQLSQIDDQNPESLTGNSENSAEFVNNQQDTQDIIKDFNETSEAAENDTNTNSYAQAIDYLDNNKTWKREEMEQFDNLHGLFDDMNQFRLQRITGKWKQDLEDSERFQEIVSVAKKNLRNGWNPAVGNHKPYYNKPNDDAIAVKNYIYWLDQDQTKSQSEKKKAVTDKKSGGTTKPAAGSGNKKID